MFIVFLFFMPINLKGVFNMSDSKDFYGISEVAKMCGVSRSTCAGWVKSGYLNSIVTPGGHHRILQEEIDRVLNHKSSGSSDVNECKTVLVVDDEPQLLKLIKAWLPMKYLHIETASNGFDAGIKLLNIRPHLVILDLFMPDIDGFELCRTIKQDADLLGTKVLALTGCDTPENKRMIMGLGADAYLSKPTDFRTLREQVQILLNNGE